jgi:hypothetical protein
MSDKNYIATPEDVEFVKQWIDKFEKSCFATQKVEEVQDWSKFREAQETYMFKGSIPSLYKPQTFYQSKNFTFYLESGDRVYIPNVKIVKSEKEFKEFINNSGYLIYRCLVGEDGSTGVRSGFAVYYHKDFGKVGWLKGRLQFQLQKFCSESFIHWFYGIKKFQFPNIQINGTNKSCD